MDSTSLSVKGVEYPQALDVADRRMGAFWTATERSDGGFVALLNWLKMGPEIGLMLERHDIANYSHI